MAQTGSAPPTLERMRIFDAIATTGTIAAAGRAVGYSASAVSQQLATLEREVGVALVERSNRGIELTPAGRALADEASRLLDDVANVIARVRATADDRLAHLSVAAFPTAITNLLLPAASQLAPEIQLTMVDSESEAAIEAVSTRAVDAAVVDGDAIGEHGRAAADLHRIELRTEPIWLVAGEGRRGGLLAFADRDWVLGPATGRLGSAARAACAEAGFAPKVIAETDDHLITFRIMATTGAVAMLPELALSDMPAGIERVTRAGPIFERRIEFATRFPPDQHPALSRLASILAAP